MLVCAAASLAALVVIAVHLPGLDPRFSATAQSEAQLAWPSQAYNTVDSAFSTELPEFTCPDLNGMDEAPQNALGPYDIETSAERTEKTAHGVSLDYRCHGAIRGWEDLVNDGALEEPMVRVDFWAQVVEDANHLTVKAADPVKAEYFQGWEHASTHTNLTVLSVQSHFPQQKAIHWYVYELRALDSNLLVDAKVHYWYLDEAFEAEPASEALAARFTEAVVDRIPRR